MEKTAQKLIGILEDGNYLDSELHDMHVYVLQKKMEQIILSVIIYAAAIKFKVVIPTILFHIIYISIRKHSGGYHCESYIACFIFSLIMYASLILIYQFRIYTLKILAVLCISSALYILITGAVNNENIHWSQEDLARTTVITRIYTIIYSIFILLMWLFNLPEGYIIFSMMGIIYPAITLLIEQIKNRIKL